jgi:hypothetical protein
MLYVYEKSSEDIKWVEETTKDFIVLYSSSNNPMKNYDNKIYKAILLKKNYDFRTIDILGKCL